MLTKGARTILIVSVNYGFACGRIRTVRKGEHMALIEHRSSLPDPRTVKALADQVIAAENELARLRAEWKALFTAPPDNEQDDLRGTLSDRILNLINSDEARTFTSGIVSRQLNANPNSVGPLLSRLVAEKKIRKVGHGDYRAHSQPVDWISEMNGLTPNENPVSSSS